MRGHETHASIATARRPTGSASVLSSKSTVEQGVLVKNVIRVFGSLLAASIAVFASPALATAEYTVSLNTCMPVDEIVDDAADFDHNFQFGYLNHKGTSTASITFMCPLPFVDGTNYNRLQLWYKDPDGSDTTGDNSQVYAELKYITNGGTTVSLATVDSDSSAATGWNYLNSAEFTHTFTPSTKAYFVLVQVIRNSSNLVPRVSAVKLFSL